MYFKISNRLHDSRMSIVRSPGVCLSSMAPYSVAVCLVQVGTKVRHSIAPCTHMAEHYMRHTLLFVAGRAGSL